MTLTRYIYSKRALWKGVYSSGSYRTKGNKKPITHFPWENQTYPHRDAWCSLSHCKLNCLKLLASIKLYFYVISFVLRNFYPFLSLLYFFMAFRFICEKYLFCFRKSSFGLDVRKAAISLQFLFNIY